MSVRNALVLFLALSTLSLLVACSSNSTAPAQPPPNGSFSNSNLSGTYVFSVSGTDANSVPFAIVGTFTANGKGGSGGITGGTVDIVDPEYTSVFGASINNDGQYRVGVDGRGQMTIGMANNPFPSNMTFDFVLQNSSHGLITQFDGNASGSGTLDVQTSGLTQSSIAGPFAFSFSGTDGNGNPLATVGAFTLDQTGNITASSGAEDFNDANVATSFSNAALTGGVALGPSGTPATVLSSALGSLTFDVYAIDSTRLKFIETDGIEFLSGSAYSQTSATVPTGTLAFTLSGFLPFAGASSVPFAAGGFMVTDGSGGITAASSEDYNNAGTTSPNPFPFSGSYSNASSIIPGRFTLNFADTFIGGSATPQYAAYPSSGGLLLLEIDNAGILTGAAYGPQSSTSFTPPQGYGLNLTGDNLTNGVEVDDIAEFSTTATTCNSSSATFCGLVDENFDPGGSPITPPQVFDGTFGAIDATGRYGLATTATNNTLNGGVGLTFYSVDGTTFPFIEFDNSGQVATGVLVLQNSADPSVAAAKSSMFTPRPLVRSHGALRKQK
jgi:hypothetical protein